MKHPIQDIDIDAIPDSDLRGVLAEVLNVLGTILTKQDAQEKEIQELRDENNRLKGGNAKPKFKARLQEKFRVSSKGKEKEGIICCSK